MDLNSILETIMSLASSVGIDLPSLIAQLSPIIETITKLISGLLG
jgi:hypothetical protein